MFSNASYANNNASVRAGHFPSNEPHYEEADFQNEDDQLDEESPSAIPLYEGELGADWRYVCSCYMTGTGLNHKSSNCLVAHLVHVLHDHSGEISDSIDLIARVILAQYPLDKCGPTKKSIPLQRSIPAGPVRGGSVQGGSRQGSVQGGSRQGSVQGGSRQGSVQGGSRQGPVYSAPAPQAASCSTTRSMASQQSHTADPMVPPPRSTRSSQQAAPPARSMPPQAEVYQRMMAQNEAIMAEMRAMGLNDNSSRYGMESLD